MNMNISLIVVDISIITDVLTVFNHQFSSSSEL